MSCCPAYCGEVPRKSWPTLSVHQQTSRGSGECEKKSRCIHVVLPQWFPPSSPSINIDVCVAVYWASEKRAVFAHRGRDTLAMRQCYIQGRTGETLCQVCTGGCFFALPGINIAKLCIVRAHGPRCCVPHSCASLSTRSSRPSALPVRLLTSLWPPHMSPARWVYGSTHGPIGPRVRQAQRR